MKYRRRASDHVDHDRWLVSYADFITLLFAFFVVMFASARMDQKKAAKLAVAIESGFQQLGAFDKKGETTNTNPASAINLERIPTELPGNIDSNAKPEDFAAIRAELEKALAPEIKRREVALRMQPDGLVVSLREIGFFDSGSAVLKPNAEDAFARVTHVIHQRSCALRIEGHTDTVPIHTSTFGSNWELSTARATEVVKVLIEKYSFAPDRLSAAGYAQYRPVASNADPQGRQLNRRVDIVILAGLLPQSLPREQTYGRSLPGPPEGETAMNLAQQRSGQQH